jgi:hypothetical protein
MDLPDLTGKEEAQDLPELQDGNEVLRVVEDVKVA